MTAPPPDARDEGERGEARDEGERGEARDEGERGEILARWARACVAEALGGGSAPAPDAPWCAVPGATFVTLRWRNGDLQGCVGTIRTVRPIVDDVARNAVAAMRDTRGVALALADLDALDVSVSILSPLTLIGPGSEAETRAAIRPGVDGLVLEHRDRRGVLLPAVWDALPDRDAFLAALRQKAGLPPGFWSDDTRLWRFSVACGVDPAPARAADGEPAGGAWP